MALDIALLDERGQPRVATQVGIEPHVRLMTLAREFHLPLFFKLEDYYKDVDFDAGEIGGLLDEVQVALSECCGDVELAEFLSGLKLLATIALRENCGLAAIAD